MRRFAALLASVVLVAGCGGGHSSKPTVVKTITSASGQRSYRVKLPNGNVVTQAHSPQLAEPPKGLQATQTQSLAGTVEQYDSVTTSTIPRSAHYVAGYVDGLYRTYPLLKGHFPVVVGISVATRDGADCFDMEPGNPGPTSAAPWAVFQFAAGNARPCEYSMLSWMPAIKANLAQHGIALCTSSSTGHCVRLWDANWTYSRHLDAGYACTQWTDHALGLNLDESTCASWFHAAPKPPPPPDPVCFHKREPKAQCDQVRAKVGAADRAVAASQRAFQVRGCPGIMARRNWFWQHINQPPASKRKYRTAAYNTSVKAFVRQGCPVFAGWQGTGGRVGFFNGKLKDLEEAN